MCCLSKTLNRKHRTNLSVAVGIIIGVVGITNHLVERSSKE
jgi:hypothetical protein